MSQGDCISNQNTRPAQDYQPAFVQVLSSPQKSGHIKTPKAQNEVQSWWVHLPAVLCCPYASVPTECGGCGGWMAGWPLDVVLS
jgi:hypothetical protein